MDVQEYLPQLKEIFEGHDVVLAYLFFTTYLLERASQRATLRSKALTEVAARDQARGGSQPWQASATSLFTSILRLTREKCTGIYNWDRTTLKPS